MPLATLDDVAEFDDEGSIVGLQFDSRERAIRDWKERQDQAEFDALCERLYQRNHARRQRSTPEGRRRQQANLHRYRQRHRSRLRQRDRERRRARYEAEPIVNRCEECGAVWCPLYETKAKKSRFCSRRCRNRSHGRRRQRSMGIRDMSLRDRLIEFLEGSPGVTTREAAAAIGAKPASLATCLCRWTQEGWLQQTSSRPARYSLTTDEETPCSP